ncbi:hypothetical protein HG536_0C00210 [Torulaspora globosa]|uniref:acid phosphatase n=1 Tax=Torulaspora globosa TaxID=48254 RepID=A0A7G3ZEB8_9SACH|nr:uncharacterized protein HG536_0C00210 [Torulaspora globosa]QLL31854.1 hypothetical protein HG536_0C00210 [Torulaspora globosa]
MLSLILSALLASPVAQGLVVPQLVELQKIGTQDDIFPYLAGDAPYFSYPNDYGIPREAPESCEMTQVQLIARHGERYPSKSRGRKLFKTWYKLSNYTKTFNGSLSFLNDDYEFFIQDLDNLEQETTLENSVNPLNPYTGEMDAKLHARDFLQQYGNLLENNTNLTVFATSSRRVHDTAKYFIDALGSDYNATLQVIDEEPSAGANTISAGYSCPAWNESAFSNITDAYSDKYLENIAKRLNKQNPGLNLTSSDSFMLFSWCAYEISARGYSDICDVFTQDELIRYSYYDDLSNYYSDGPGYPLIKDVGSNLFNATVKLLKQSEELDQKAWLSFTHDTDILNYLTTVGLFDDGNPLNATYVPFRDHVFHKSWQVPMGARVYTQKFQCSNESYVRYVVNDAVIPIESCSSGPGFSCPEDDFYDYAASRLQGLNFAAACDVTSVSNVTSLTYYWDYNTTNYNATLLDQ